MFYFLPSFFITQYTAHFVNTARLKKINKKKACREKTLGHGRARTVQPKLVPNSRPPDPAIMPKYPVSLAAIYLLIFSRLPV